MKQFEISIYNKNKKCYFGFSGRVRGVGREPRQKTIRNDCSSQPWSCNHWRWRWQPEPARTHHRHTEPLQWASWRPPPPPHLPNHPTQPIAEVKLDRRFESAGKGKGKALLYVQSNSIWARVRRIGKIKFAFLLRPCWSDDFRFSISGMVDMQFYKCFSTDYESILIRW